MLQAMGTLHLHHKPYARLWEGRAVIGGKVSTHIIMQAPGPPLMDDRKRVETVSRQHDES